MPTRKKTYPCGHTGRGQYCHRCANEKAAAERAERQRAQADAARRAWAERLQAAPIPLDHLPRRIAEKTLDLIDALGDGTPYTDLHGKRLTNMGQRQIISIPIGRRFRLICRDADDQLTCLEAISHEDYNNRLNSGGWR